MSTKLFQALPHAHDPDTRRERALDAIPPAAGKAAAMIRDLNDHGVPLETNGDRPIRAAGMTVNVRDTLLRYAEQCGFHIAGKTRDVSLDHQIQLDFAALVETPNEPLEGGNEPSSSSNGG